MLEVKRRAIKELLSEIKIDKPIKLPFEEEVLRNLFFDEIITSTGKRYYIFNRELLEVRSKINYSNIPLDEVDVSKMDFSQMYGIKINPQTIYDNDLKNTILKGVEFIGNDKINQTDIFKNVKLSGANFTGSKGARINPQTVYGKCFDLAILADVDFTGFSFKDAQIYNTKFKGSRGARINPNEVSYTKDTLFDDVELTDLPGNGKWISTLNNNYQELLDKKDEYKKEVFAIIKEQIPPKQEEKEEPPKQVPQPKRKKLSLSYLLYDGDDVW